jgi:glycerophosphoryl diester phosphodiesterase
MLEWLESLVPWGTEVIVWAQALGNGVFEPVAVFFTRLGYQEFYIFALPIVYWCIDRSTGVALAFLAMLSIWINSAIKYLFAIPRPSDPRMRVPLPESDPSFPSGHAQNAVVVWGYLAYRFRSWLLWAVAGIAVLGISLSRIVLGVHYPQDTIGGWFIGLVVLVTYVKIAPSVGRWHGGQRMALQLGLAVAIPVLLMYLHPADTEGFYPAKQIIRPMSAVVGIGVGTVMERAYVRFDARGVWWRRVLRFLVGIAVVAVFYIVPTLVIPEGLPYGLESGLRIARYIALGWVGSFLCPWLFLRLRLASREGDASAEARQVAALGDRRAGRSPQSLGSDR